MSSRRGRTRSAPGGSWPAAGSTCTSPAPKEENSDRALKLTAENLFLTLADPSTEPTPENARLLQFLALMLERKKVLRLRGRTDDGAKNRLEHMTSRQMFEIPADDLTPEFFVAIQEQLSVLVGEPKGEGAAVPAAVSRALGWGGLPSIPARCDVAPAFYIMRSQTAY